MDDITAQELGTWLLASIPGAIIGVGVSALLNVGPIGGMAAMGACIAVEWLVVYVVWARFFNE